MKNYSEINDLDLARFYIKKITDHVRRSYVLLTKELYPIEERYQLSLSYLSLAENTYLQFRKHQNEKELFGSYIEDFEKPLNLCLFQFHKCIEEREDNFSWLNGQYEDYIDQSSKTIDKLTDLIRS
ncbi:hypothetical protein ACW0KB_12085 [Virgibacillus salarius]